MSKSLSTMALAVVLGALASEQGAYGVLSLKLTATMKAPKDTELSEYEKERLANIAANNQRLAALGLLKDTPIDSSPSRPKKRKAEAKTAKPSSFWGIKLKLQGVDEGTIVRRQVQAANMKQYGTLKAPRKHNGVGFDQSTYWGRDVNGPRTERLNYAEQSSDEDDDETVFKPTGNTRWSAPGKQKVKKREARPVTPSSGYGTELVQSDKEDTEERASTPSSSASSLLGVGSSDDTASFYGEIEKSPPRLPEYDERMSGFASPAPALVITGNANGLNEYGFDMGKHAKSEYGGNSIRIGEKYQASDLPAASSHNLYGSPDLSEISRLLNESPVQYERDPVQNDRLKEVSKDSKFVPIKDSELNKFFYGDSATDSDHEMSYDGGSDDEMSIYGDGDRDTYGVVPYVEWERACATDIRSQVIDGAIETLTNRQKKRLSLEKNQDQKRTFEDKVMEDFYGWNGKDERTPKQIFDEAFGKQAAAQVKSRTKR